jgi:hypothetical protein
MTICPRCGRGESKAENLKKVEEFFNIHQARFTENQIKYIKIELINNILRSPNKSENQTFGGLKHNKRNLNMCLNKSKGFVNLPQQVQTGSDTLLYLTELKEKIDKKKSEVGKK